MSMNKTAKSFVAFFEVAAAERAEKAEAIKATLENKEIVTKKEKKAVSTQETHAKWNQRVAEMSPEASNLVYKFKIDPTAFEAQSRECKKRSIGIMEAISKGSTSAIDNSLDAFLHFVAAKLESGKQITTRDFVREAGHSTSTQAGYAKNCFKFLGVIKDAPKIETGIFLFDFDPESAVFIELMKLYK